MCVLCDINERMDNLKKERIIELLESLQEDVDSWDRDDKKIDKLADDTIEALQYTVNFIKTSNIVGTLNINDETYTVLK